MTRHVSAPAGWSPTSWQRKVSRQQPTYPDPERLDEVVHRLSHLPPLVTSREIESLRGQLAQATRGERFLLQGGDCVESFDACEPTVIANTVRILLQMSLILIHGGRKPLIRVGRIAGQYVKPRSSPTETRGGVTLPSYRGDLVNAEGFSVAERTRDPERLLRGYERAALTLNFVRSLTAGEFSELHRAESWDLSFVNRSPRASEYRRVAESIGESFRFLEAFSANEAAELSRPDLFASHEGLHLHYEQAQTRRVPRRSGWYNVTTHLPWIGDRTRALDGAHVEYFRGIRNPIGVKVGPSMSPDELVLLTQVLNPSNEPGRLVLIHRFGAQRITTCLPPLIDAVQRVGAAVLWCCDPMHGNTELTRDGLKTRNFNRILAELELAFEVHEDAGSRLGGVHFELTGEDVTECTGGARGLTETDLRRAYRSQVDPRLNYEQALEMAMLAAQRMANGRPRPLSARARKTAGSQDATTRTV